jgi:hypothetical protein
VFKNDNRTVDNIQTFESVSIGYLEPDEASIRFQSEADTVDLKMPDSQYFAYTRGPLEGFVRGLSLSRLCFFLALLTSKNKHSTDDKWVVRISQ